MSGLLFDCCVRWEPTDERVPGSESVKFGWPHTLPGVLASSDLTAWMVRTDTGVQRQYEEWLRANHSKAHRP